MLCRPRLLAARSALPLRLLPETALDLLRAAEPEGAAAGRVAGLLACGADGGARPRSAVAVRCALDAGLAGVFAAGLAGAFAAGLAVGRSSLLAAWLEAGFAPA
jgi:hypothetical protein